MNPATIIRELQADGVALELSPAGSIKARGEGAKVNRWLGTIRAHKAGIIDALQSRREDSSPEPFDREAWEERAAICEFDGGLTRAEAEAIAWEEDQRRRERFNASKGVPK